MSGVVNGPETIGTMSCVVNEPDVEFIALCVTMMAAFAVLMVASLVLSAIESCHFFKLCRSTL